jgi:membrane protein
MAQPRVYQTYAQECGICAVKNLLRCYHLSYQKVSQILFYSKQGNSLEEIKQSLKYFFQTVIVAQMDLEQLRKLKKIKPFILLFQKDQSFHFVVVKQKKKQKFCIIDSSILYDVKMSLEEMKKKATNIVILVEHPIKQKKVKKQKMKRTLSFYIAPLFCILESVFLMQLTLYLQKIVDQNTNYIYFYLAIQLILQGIMLLKSKIFLTLYQKLDQLFPLKVFQSFYHLRPDFLNQRNTEEVLYRLQDAYQMKYLMLSFLFELVGNLSLILFSFILLMAYQPYFLLIIFILIPVFLFCVKSLKKQRHLKEEKRQLEVQFFDQIRLDLQSKKRDGFHFKQRLQTFIDFQKKAYQIEKNEIIKNHVLFFVQNGLMTLFLIIYAFRLLPSFSVGQLMVGLQIMSMIIQPLFQILMQTNQYANYQLLKMRLEELFQNIDKEN